MSFLNDIGGRWRLPFYAGALFVLLGAGMKCWTGVASLRPFVVGFCLMALGLVGAVVRRVRFAAPPPSEGDGRAEE